MYRKLLRKIRSEFMKPRLKNKNPTILASNCNGTIIMHELGIRFRTPTVNLYILSKDFIKFVQNLDHYISLELEPYEGENLPHPAGKLGDIVIYFVHYKSFQHAKEKWDERKRRINKENIFIMMTERDGCTYEDMIVFDKLPYKNKIIFTKKEYRDIKSGYHIHGFENEDSVGELTEYENKLLGKRYLDQFDYVSFLNKESCKPT